MTKLKQLIEMNDVLSQNEFKALASEINIKDLLDSWEIIDTELQEKIFNSLEYDKAIDVMLNLNHTQQENILKALPEENIKDIVEKLEPDDITDFVQELSPEIRKSIWNNLSDKARRETLYLLRYDEEEAAGLMTPRFLALKSEATVGQAIEFVRRNCIFTEIINYIYVIDNEKHLKGVVSLKDLLSNKDTLAIKRIMSENPISVDAGLDQEEVAKVLETYSLVALPVVDDEYKLLGIVTFDDVIDVIREEQTEDVYKMQAISKNTTSYKETPPLKLVLKRIPWLIVLLFLGTFTTIVMERYQDQLSSIAILAAFLPLIIQTGGNSGGQSSTLMIRGLATGDLRFRDTGKIILKELIVGFVMATSLCIAVFLIIQLRNLMAMGNFIFHDPITITQALTIATAFFFVVIISNLIGAIAPMLITGMGFDPTVMSAPLMATLIDVLGLTIYFEIARMILHL